MSVPIDIRKCISKLNDNDSKKFIKKSINKLYDFICNNNEILELKVKKDLVNIIMNLIYDKIEYIRSKSILILSEYYENDIDYKEYLIIISKVFNNENSEELRLEYIKLLSNYIPNDIKDIEILINIYISSCKDMFPELKNKPLKI